MKIFDGGKLFIFVFFFFVRLTNCNSLTKKPVKTLLLDTNHTEKFLYQPFLKIAKNYGFEIDYKGIDQFLDDKVNLQNYNALFVIFGIEFLKGTNKSFVTRRILQFLEKFSQQSEKLIGFVFPALKMSKKVDFVSVLNPIFRGVVNRNKEGFQAFLKDINIFLGVPLEARVGYNTTLRLPRNLFLDVYSMLDLANLNFLILPLQKKFSSSVLHTLPYGIYSFDEIKKNHLFVTFSKLFSFSSVTEDFQFCPTNFSKRREIHEAIGRTLFELNLLIKQKKITQKKVKKIKESSMPSLPLSIINIGNVFDLHRHNSGLRKIGWMEINCFEKNEQFQQQKILIDSIFESGLDALWITFNPNYYYSPIAIRKKNKEKFLSSISGFTKSLKKESIKLNKKLPKILIGFEIANNLYKPNLPKHFAVDLYGGSYPDLPSPLNQKFWNEEIKKSLSLFLNDWEKPGINNGVRLSGVVLDLEMYSRKQSGTFLDSFGFSLENIDAFNMSKNSKLKKEQRLYRKSISFLTDKKLLGDYFDFLKKRAESIGKDLKLFFEKQIPNCIVCAYAPNISTNWFYPAFYKGLCDSKKIYLFTFNSEFFSHKNWLKQNGIFAKHLSVLLLSKIRNKKNFKYVNYVLNHNDGVWLNRFSRFAEDYEKKRWCFLEQTPLLQKQRKQFLRYLNSI